MTEYLQHAIEPPWQGWGGDFQHTYIFFCMVSQHPEKGKPVRVQIREREREIKYIYIIQNIVYTV